MAGPEGRIFGPMADTYAFALGGALLLAVTLSPVLCSSAAAAGCSPRPTISSCAGMQASYLRQLQLVPAASLDHAWRCFAGVVAITLAVLPLLGREFMPELEEGNIWVQAQLPLKSSLDETSASVRIARGRS